MLAGVYIRGEVNSSRSEISNRREIIHVYIELSMWLEINIFHFTSCKRSLIHYVPIYLGLK